MELDENVWCSFTKSIEAKRGGKILVIGNVKKLFKNIYLIAVDFLRPR